MAGLQTAALHCEFKELDDALLDWLVCGLKDLRIQHRLLTKPDLMLQSALDGACAVELSNKSMVEIHGASSPVSGEKTLAIHQEEATEEDTDLPGDDNIHQLKTASGKYWQSTKTAQAQSCIGFKTVNCQCCGKRGHLARKCRAILPDGRVQAKQGQSKGTPRKVPRLGEDHFTIQTGW
ncbi:hypothetical protein E2320_009744 [Naja naja]|nr:hypothetical protein E2320_009744 [Naja naja]